MLTSRKLFTADTTPTEDNTQAAVAAYEREAAAPGLAGELGDAVVAQNFNDLIRNLEVIVKAAGFSLRTEDVAATVTVGSGSNAQTVPRRDAILARAVLALASGTAQTSFFGLTDTPASAAAGNDGDAVVLSGSNLVLKTLVNTVRVETRAPSTTDDSSSGSVWIFGGHTFIYRGVVASQHVWDVSGIWATANIAGTPQSAPTGYTLRTGISETVGRGSLLSIGVVAVSTIIKCKTLAARTTMRSRSRLIIRQHKLALGDLLITAKTWVSLTRRRTVSARHLDTRTAVLDLTPRIRSSSRGLELPNGDFAPRNSRRQSGH